MQYGSKLEVIDESATKQMEQEAFEQFEILADGLFETAGHVLAQVLKAFRTTAIQLSLDWYGLLSKKSPLKKYDE